MADVARRILISGRVQGVAYRAWAIEEARALGLRGWVRNLPDGRVEALAAGPEDDVAAFVEVCRRGPVAARVVGVETAEAEDDGLGPFEMRG